MNSSPCNSILILNDDCLHHIFSYIVNIRERLRLIRVCKRFEQLIECGLKTDAVYLHMKNILYPSEFNDIRKYESIKFKSSQLFGVCRKIIEFHNEILDFTDEQDGLLGFSDSDVSGLSFVDKLVLKARHTSRFKSNWTMDTIDSDYAEFKWLLSRCVQLKTLHAFDFHLDSFVLEMVPKSLLHLSLINISFDPKDFEQFLSTHGQQLTGFKYSRKSAIPLEFDRTIVNLISQYCHNLEKLELTLTYPELIYFGSFKKLNHLTIDGTGRSIVFYEYAIQNCPNLTSCKLTFKVLPSTETLTRWNNIFPNLKDIQFQPEQTCYLALCM